MFSLLTKHSILTEDVEDSLLEKISSLGLKFGCNLRIDLMTEERIKKYIKHGLY